MRFLYPMSLDVSDRQIVIVGGGGVAARKAEGLLEAGARRIRVVAPEIRIEDRLGVERVLERYRPEHLEGAGLVFAATDEPAVNAAVVRDAHARGLLVCRADSDDREPGDFATPALFRDGPLTVTVSATGAPALAAKVRDALAEGFDRRWARLGDALQTLRPEILAAAPPQERRRILHELVSEPAVEALEAGGLPGLRKWIMSRYPDVKL